MSLHTTTINKAISNIEDETNALFDIANHPKNYNCESAHVLNIVLRDIREHISYLREHHYMFGSL